MFVVKNKTKKKETKTKTKTLIARTILRHNFHKIVKIDLKPRKDTNKICLLLHIHIQVQAFKPKFIHTYVHVPRNTYFPLPVF